MTSASDSLPQVPLDVSTSLAVERTRVSYERTMLSWVRTATSLITFGFGVYKFFQIERPKGIEGQIIGPAGFGTVLVAIGLLSLLLATIEFRQNLRTLGKDYSARKQSTSVLVAGVIAALGIVAFVVMTLHG